MKTIAPCKLQGAIFLPLILNAKKRVKLVSECAKARLT